MLSPRLTGLRRPYALGAWAAILAACTSAPPAPFPPPLPETGPSKLASTSLIEPVPVNWDDLPGWSNDHHAQAWPALRQSCAALAKQLPWQAPCVAAAAIDGGNDEIDRAFFEGNFTPYALRRGDNHPGLVTGYYEPLLRGSRTPTPKYRVPIYAPPDDLLAIELGGLVPELQGMRLRGRIEGQKVVPYWSRADIDAGRAPLHGRELAWVDDPLQAFFMQVQGCGRIAFDDGSVLRLGYADQNGQPYRSIGHALALRGNLAPESASMQAIAAWGRQHPDLLPALLEENPSFVFFRVLPIPDGPADGPPGALGVPLTAGRSLAVDPRFSSLGAPLYMATNWPNSTAPLDRLVFAQDTGAGIRGPLRGDLFWGFGEEAARQAGKMREPAQFWLLWPKGSPPPKYAESAGGP